MEADMEAEVETAVGAEAVEAEAVEVGVEVEAVARRSSPLHRSRC